MAEKKNQSSAHPFSHPIPVLYSSKNRPSYFAPQTPESTSDFSTDFSTAFPTASTASTDTQDTSDIVQLVHEKLNTLAGRRVNKKPATKSNRINNTPAVAPNRNRFLASGQPRTPPDQLHAENVRLLNEIIKESGASEPPRSTNQMMMVPGAQNYVSIENIKTAPAPATAPNASTEKERRTMNETPQNVEGPVQQVTQFLKTLFS